jgi:3-deoxy-manno-octulosonate cytidylyltransferase (CMP-KDO synthetase)
MVVIPARYASSRLPGKPLLDICGRPMIEHVYRRAARAVGASAVLVATDDARILRAVERFGGRAVMTRPDHPSGSDRVAEAAGALAVDLVVNLQGDEPLIEPAVIGEVLAPLLAEPDVRMATVRRRIEDPGELSDPHVVKVVVDRDGFALYFSRAPIPFVRCPPPDAAGGAFKHIGLYAYRRDFLLALAGLEPTPLERAEALEQLRALEHGFRIRTVETVHDTVGVDTEEDLERVRRLVQAAARV